MFSKLLILALTTTPLISAHGKVAVVTGNLGGNTTALGIQGGIVPGEGPNDITEVDTTVFGRRSIQSNGLGRTQDGGKNKVSMLSSAIEQSGNVLPQVSKTNGSISGVFHIVTSDGAGPLKAVLDPTATGKFKNGVMLEVVTQVPGKGGNIKPQNKNQDQEQDQDDDGDDNDDENGSERRRDLRWAKRGDAVNINLDFPMEFKVPDGTNCTGVVDGVEGGVCLVKIANSNGAGPFGGVIAIQMVDSEPTFATPTTTASAGGGSAGATTTATPTLPSAVIVTSTGIARVNAHLEQVAGKARRWFGA